MDAPDLLADPMDQVAAWLADAVAADLVDPHAMVLSTAGADGRPRGRHVLLKGLGPDGLRFFTGYGSTKARQIAENPWGCATFPWFMMEPRRQVIVEGSIEQLSAGDSDAYFASRDRGSQIGAWASDQSAVIPDRSWLDDRVAEIEARFPDDVPRPPYWGGYLLRPSVVELWQGRPNRLHDRFRYTAEADSTWTIERLSP